MKVPVLRSLCRPKVLQLFKDITAMMFFCEYCEFFQSTSFERTFENDGLLNSFSTEY